MGSTAQIPAASRREAMDWGLVLISQGIESTIEGSEETGGWGLQVEPRDYEPALGAIRQYCRENRDWPWRQRLSHTGQWFDWGGLAWVFLTVFFYLLETELNLAGAGDLDTTLVSGGQWWRLFTAVWLHADVGHLAENAALGFVLIGLALGRYGTGIGLCAASLAGAGGNVASWLLGVQPHRSLGASGLVMGAVGLLAAEALGAGSALPARRRVGGVVAGLMLFVLMGLTPGTDVLAHAGGFLTGLVLGAGLSRVPALARRTGLNLLGGLLFVALVVGPWLLALARR